MCTKTRHAIKMNLLQTVCSLSAAAILLILQSCSSDAHWTSSVSEPLSSISYLSDQKYNESNTGNKCFNVCWIIQLWNSRQLLKKALKNLVHFLLNISQHFNLQLREREYCVTIFDKLITNDPFFTSIKLFLTLF